MCCIMFARLALHDVCRQQLSPLVHCSSPIQRPLIVRGSCLLLLLARPLLLHAGPCVKPVVAPIQGAQPDCIHIFLCILGCDVWVQLLLLRVPCRQQMIRKALTTHLVHLVILHSRAVHFKSSKSPLPPAHLCLTLNVATSPRYGSRPIVSRSLPHLALYAS